MEISDTKIATGAIVIVIGVLTTSAAIGAIAGLAGFDMGKKAA